MSNEKALFDEDFEDVFSDDPLADLVRPSAANDATDEQDTVAEDAASGAALHNPVEQDLSAFGHGEPSGGDVMLPAISIKLNEQYGKNGAKVDAESYRAPVGFIEE